jgi:hypothetical protein
MALDYDALLYGPLYDQDTGFGVAALLDPDSTGEIALTVIDKTEGVLLDEGRGLQIATVKAAALVRMSELAANGILRAALKQRTIAFNNGTWTILSTEPKPNPAGGGELYLILEKA